MVAEFHTAGLNPDASTKRPQHPAHGASRSARDRYRPPKLRSECGVNSTRRISERGSAPIVLVVLRAESAPIPALWDIHV